jgi:adenylate cyclase
VRPTANTLVFQYKGKTPDIRQVGRELGIRYVLEGSIRRVNNRVRANAQLISANDGTHLWAERYDRVLEDIFEIQDELVLYRPASGGTRR